MKPITAFLVFQEIERGALRLDAPAAGYLSDFPAPIDPRITVADLLIHASGIVDYVNDLGEDAYAARYLHQRVPADSVVAEMVRLPLEFEPGTDHDYSNTGCRTRPRRPRPRPGRRRRPRGSARVRGSGP